jgi:hypothetical protein
MLYLVIAILLTQMVYWLKKKHEYFFSWSMLIYYGCFLPSCATFVRRRVIEEGVLLDSEFKVTMDLDWYVRMAKAGYRFAHLPISLASFALGMKLILVLHLLGDGYWNGGWFKTGTVA